MGLLAIGPTAFFSLGQVGLLVSVEDLTIYRNTIVNSVQHMPTEIPEGMMDEAGFGGIVLPACEEVIIQENWLENDGVSHVEPACGVLVLFGEKTDISNNRIPNNGPRTSDDDVDVRRGLRGGVVIRMSFKQLAYKVLQDKELLQPDGIPAAKIHVNIIAQPLGQALFIMAFGPVWAVGNHLT